MKVASKVVESLFIEWSFESYLQINGTVRHESGLKFQQR